VEKEMEEASRPGEMEEALKAILEMIRCMEEVE